MIAKRLAGLGRACLLPVALIVATLAAYAAEPAASAEPAATTTAPPAAAAEETAAPADRGTGESATVDAAAAAAAGDAQRDATDGQHAADAEAGFGSTRDAAVNDALTRLGLGKRATTLPLAEGGAVALLLPPAAGRPATGGLLIVPAPRAAVADPLVLALARTAAAGGWLALALQPREEAAAGPGAGKGPADAAGEDAPAEAAPDLTSGTAEKTVDTGGTATPILCAQMTAAFETLVARGVSEIVIVAVGAQVARSLACAPSLPQPVVALVALGRWQGALDALDVPVLELPPAQDRLALRFAAARADAATDKPPAAYRQVPIDVADDRYQGGEFDVAKRVRGWVAQLPRKPAT